MPEITVIVPVYNAEKYLSECIDSIIAQTYSDWELLLIDDGSTDNSPAICDQYAAKDPRIRVFHKTNGGVSSARNLGLDNACGNWITFIDSDDWVDPFFLYKLFEKGSSEKADIIFSNFILYYKHKANEIYEFPKWDSKKDRINNLSDYFYTKWNIACSTLLRRQLLTSISLKFQDDISFCEDWLFISKALYFADNIANVTDPLYFYRQNEASACYNFSEKNLEDQIRVVKDIATFFKEQGCYEPLEKALNHRLLSFTKFMILRTDYFDRFISINHNSKKYIFSCPWGYNLKLKIFAWCLTHHLRPAASAFVWMRKLLGR